jgi:hypothetical protein
MVVKKSVKKEKPTLEQLEESSKEEINQADGKRQDIQSKINEKYLDAQFYFSVVFTSKDERDKWCLDHAVKLKDSEYILSRDYIIDIRKA